MLEPNIEKFEEFETYEDFTDLKVDQLLTEIWLKPKKVFAYLFKHEPSKYVEGLLLASAFASATNRAIEKSLEYGANINFITLIISGFAAYLLYYVLAWLYKFFGSAFLNGNATSKQFRTVIAWGYIPSLLILVTSFLYYIVYSSNESEEILSFNPQAIVFWLFALIELALGIYSIALLVIGTMHIQKFGVWKALGNIFLPIISIGLIFALVFILGDLITNL